MGNPPDYKRIAKEDFPTQYQGLIDKLAFPLNSHMEQVRDLFTKQIDTQNLTRELTAISVQTDDKSVPISAISFKTALTNKILGIAVISAKITSSNTQQITQAPFITFSQNSNIVTVSNIAGLAANTTYSFLLEVIS